MKIHPVVAAHMAVQLAKSAERVAKLEAALRTTPVNAGRTWASVNVSKRLTEERAQLASWNVLVDVMNATNAHNCDRDGCDGSTGL